MTDSADLYVVIRLIVGSVFLVSGVAKLRRGRHFISALVEYRYVAPSRARWLAPSLIGAELILATSHLTGAGIPLLAWGGLALLSCFAIVVTRRIAKGLSGPCLCFGG